MPFEIGVVGPLNIDLIIRGSAPSDVKELNTWSGASDVYCLTAGAAGYISQNLKKLGNKVNLVSCIGDDSFGVMIDKSLLNMGISPAFVDIEKDTEGAIAIFILLFGNNKRPLTFRLPTHHGWPRKISKTAKEHLFKTQLLHSAGYLHFPDLWNEDFINLLKEAKEKGLLVSMDPQFPLSPLDPPWFKVLERLIPYIDIFMVDENEALNITGKKTEEEAAQFLIKSGLKKVAIKLGQRGVLVKDDKYEETIPAIPPKEFIDSIGAGDSFDAGFLQGILEGEDIITAGKMGVKAATMSIEGVGGSNTFPTREKLIL